MKLQVKITAVEDHFDSLCSATSDHNICYHYVLTGVIEAPKGLILENSIQTIAFQPGSISCAIKIDNEALEDKDYQGIHLSLNRDFWRMPDDSGPFSCQILLRKTELKTEKNYNESFLFYGPLVTYEPIDYDNNAIYEYVKQGMAINIMMDEFHQFVMADKKSIDSVYGGTPENSFLQYVWGFNEVKYAISSTVSIDHKKAIDEYHLLALKRMNEKLDKEDEKRYQMLSKRYIMCHVYMNTDINYRERIMKENEAGLFPHPSILSFEEEVERINIRSRMGN